MSEHPVRVSCRFPCPVCKKTDWCMVGDRFVLCMRVHSTRSKQLADGSEGWLHPKAENYEPPKYLKREDPKPQVNFPELLSLWLENTDELDISDFAAGLGVDVQSLLWLQACQQHPGIWAFPMRDGHNGVVGIRLRTDSGEKFAVRGSHQGLFIPQCEPDPMTLVCEGPTDTAAALSMGYYAIGRPSCSGGIDHIREFVKCSAIRRVAIVSDLDDPGIRGAKTLQEHVGVSSVIVLCPAKDVRQFVVNGGTRAAFDSIIKQLVWR